MTRLGSLSEVHLQELILRDDLLVATHLRAVEPAALLATTPSFSCTESRVLRLHGTLLIARYAVKLANCRLSPGSPCEALIACLVEHKVFGLNIGEEAHWQTKEEAEHD